MVLDRRDYLSGTVIRAREDRLTNEFTEKLGYAFALWLSRRLDMKSDQMTISVGHDSRASGPRLAKAIMDGLTQADCDVYDCGMATTPAMQLSIEDPAIHCDGAVMVTASACGAGINGMKLFARDDSISAEDLAAIFDLAVHVDVPKRLVKPLFLMTAYQDKLRKAVYASFEEEVKMPLLGLHVIVDASGGSCGFYTSFLESLGADTTGSMNLTPDPNFAAHEPNPERSEALTLLSQRVVEAGADIGVLFDADGDRAAIVDSNGKTIHRNRLIALLAAILLEDEPGLTFVTDSVTSSGLTRFITEWGGVHYRFRRGYRNVIDEAYRLNEEGINCPVAIETSGHAALRDNFFIDDGVYLVTQLICEAVYRKRAGKTLSSLLEGLAEPVESLEIRLPIIQEDVRKAAGYVIEAILSHTLTHPEWRLASDNREGVRILFSLDGGVDNAWFMVRLSVHDPVMPLNAESDVPGGIQRILTELYSVLAVDNEELDLTPLAKAIGAPASPTA